MLTIDCFLSYSYYSCSLRQVFMDADVEKMPAAKRKKQKMEQMEPVRLISPTPVKASIPMEAQVPNQTKLSNQELIQLLTNQAILLANQSQMMLNQAEMLSRV